MRPESYFTNPRERALTKLIWDRAPVYRLKGFEGATRLPWASTRVIKAGGLSMEMRYGTHNLGPAARACNAIEKANVEHFWCGAMLGTIGGPFGLVGGTALSFVYDGIISPLSKVFSGRELTKILDGIKNDFRQFSGPDMNGVKFGAIHHTRFFWMDRD